MSSGPQKLGSSSKLGTASPFGAAPSAHTLLLDKLQGRTSTPDSEALTSSDDENDHRQSSSSNPQYSAPPIQNQDRRRSWLNDSSAMIASTRKSSFVGASMSPTGSNPTTPLSEAGPGPIVWNAPQPGMGRSGANPAVATNFSASWAQGIWASDRKDPPLRLSEVLPSPTSSVPPDGIGDSFFPESALSQSSNAPRDSGINSTIPFPIPLHPTPKTYRSQSYSVGQLEQESPAAPAGMTSLANLGRHRNLSHRPSRPSMLSEMTDGGILGKVKEVDDDDVESNVQLPHDPQKMSATIEMLQRENAMLRQQQQHQHQQPRIRLRTSAQSLFGQSGNYGGNHNFSESDYAIDEVDESNEGMVSYAAGQGIQRRMSEFGAAFRPENKKLETLKQGAWQTPHFSGLGDISQSRRHSFADIPVRPPSLGSLAESVTALDTNGGDPLQSEFSPVFAEKPFPVGSPGSYMVGAGSSTPTQTPQSFGGAFGSPFTTHNPFSNRPPSPPHRNVYSGMVQPRHNQKLQIVLFKCVRADVFYISEGTGLTVKKGDLVIVEADRGTDLGTVAYDSVDWQTAKQIKEYYAEEHYKWLMMYSQNATASHDDTGIQGSAVGGMGPGGQHHVQEPSTGELKPKLIKRLAQACEVQQLGEKEGGEAKAKRTCMQKVKEHNLNMEILDAEYQFDRKKLTFYYFADSYINFNSLVTDLFKIYKTRIWMSAINPASFASPTLGIQAPSGVGIGAVGVQAPAVTDRRQSQAQLKLTESQSQSQSQLQSQSHSHSHSQSQPHQPHQPAQRQPQSQSQSSQSQSQSQSHPQSHPQSQLEPQAQQPAYTPATHIRGYQPMAIHPDFGSDGLQAFAQSVTDYPFQQLSAFGAISRPANNTFMSRNPDMYLPRGGLNLGHNRFAANSPGGTRTSAHAPAVSPVSSQRDWFGLQGLSLN